jgi:hypothetical protein
MSEIEVPDFTDQATCLWQFIRSMPDEMRHNDAGISAIRSYLGIAYWTGRDQAARADLERLSKPRGAMTVTSRMP